MRTKSSPIWEYFEQADHDVSIAICKECKAKISRGSKIVKKMTTSNLKSHLAKKHVEDYKKFLAVDEENNQRKRKLEEEEVEENEGVGETSFNMRNRQGKKQFLQQSIPDVMKVAGLEWKFNDPKNIQCHKSVLRMMIFDLRPFNEVNKKGFLQMVKTLQPKFNPGSDKYYRDLMNKTFKECKEKLKQNLMDANPQDVALVLDGWSQFHHGYVGINIHFITDEWVRKQYNIGCVPLDTSHTGDAMARLTEALVREWNILDKITFMVRDSAANMVRMGNLVNWKHGDCTNHTLQLCIKDELFDLTSVENLILKCRKVCKYANHGVEFVHELMLAQEPLEEGHHAKQLQQDVITRWNSTFDMLERFLELKVPLIEVMGREKWATKIEDNFYNADWELMNKVVLVLKGFKEATLMLSKSSASISQVIPIVKLIKDSLEVSPRADHGVKKFKKDLKAALERRFDEKEDLEEYTIATLLDPRYKKIFFRDPLKCEAAVQLLLVKLRDEMRNDIDLLLLPPAPVEVALLDLDPPEMTIKNLMKKAVEASQVVVDGEVDEETVLTNYLNSPLEEKRCLKFWKDFEQSAGVCKIKLALCRLAKMHLTPPATSTDVERLFSVAALILDEKRNRLLPENVQQLLFLNANMENYNYQL